MGPVDSPLLTVEGLEKRFGGIDALSDYGLTIQRFELVGLIGPNGAGKTTVFNLLSGVLKPTRGRIVFDGQEMTRLRADQAAALGVARTFQNIRLFNGLSVLDNIKVAVHMRLGTGFVGAVLHSRAFRTAEREIDRLANEFIELMDLTGVRDELAGRLPYGVQRRVEICRALATNPKLLLLDEPSAGMNPQETRDLIQLIQLIFKEHHLTILLVEHDMSVVMSICQRIQVLNRGRVLAMGAPEEIRRDPRVIEAYLGAPKEQCDA